MRQQVILAIYRIFRTISCSFCLIGSSNTLAMMKQWIWLCHTYIRAYMKGHKSKSSKTHSCKGSTCRLTQNADSMKASSPLFLSIAVFIVIASLYETSEAFFGSISARRDQLRMEKLKKRLEEERIERRMQAVEEEEQDVQRKLRHLQKWVQKYKAKSRAKVSLFFFENTHPFYCKNL